MLIQGDFQKFNDRTKLSWSDFKVQSLLGKGSVGEVFLCTLTADFKNITKGLYAVKRMPKTKVKGKGYMNSINTEKEIMKGSASSFFVGFVCSFKD
jgi:serine/threonine protein kinase